MSRRLLAPLLLAATAVHGQWQWEQLPDFPGTPRDDAAAFSIGCHTYVGTGMQVGWSLTNDWWRYDNWNQLWEAAPALPATPRQYCTAQAIGGTGFLFGGLDASGPLNELWAFDAATQAWEARAPLPGPGRYACSSFTANGMLYVCCGIVAGGDALNELWAYDPATDEWTQRSGIPGVGRHRAAAIAQQGLVLGGAEASYMPLVEVWQYDAQSDGWQPQAPLTEARFGAAGADWYGTTLIAGAVDNATFRADALRFDPATQEWQSADAVLPSTRRGGVVSAGSCAPGHSYLRYGLGLDGSMTRRNDWLGDDLAIGMQEYAAQRFTMHPNPVHDQARLSISDRWRLRIIDLEGREAPKPAWMDEGLINLSALAPGAYILEAEQAGTRLATTFIKMP